MRKLGAGSRMAVGGGIAMAISLIAQPTFGQGFWHSGPSFGGSHMGFGHFNPSFMSGPPTTNSPTTERPPSRPSHARHIVRKPAPARKFVSNAHLPAPGETRFRRGEVLVTISSVVAPSIVAQILRRHNLAETNSTPIGSAGMSMRLWRIPDTRDVRAVLRELDGEPALASIQPNYIYKVQDELSVSQQPQYALAKLNVDASLDLSTAAPIRVALIDEAVDESHPALAGSIEASFDAIGGGPPNKLDHGTSMAGAIAAHGWMKGVAPHARLLVARALDDNATDGNLGTTYSVVRACYWAVEKRANIINMSFTSAPDPDLYDCLAYAAKKGISLVAAAGNEGPNAPPMYPAAYPLVIAVTATDEDDKLYALAAVGPYVAVAAPGVNVTLPRPRGGYDYVNGTSVSAALVTGVVALMLERRPAAAPAEIAGWLKGTARPLDAGSTRALFSVGLVDARRAALAAAPVAGK